VDALAIQRDRFPAGIVPSLATVQHNLHRSFQIDPLPAGTGILVQGGHELVLGFERDGVHPRQPRLDRGLL